MFGANPHFSLESVSPAWLQTTDGSYDLCIWKDGIILADCQLSEGGWFQILIKKIYNHTEWTEWQNVITGASFHRKCSTPLQHEIWCAVAGSSSIGFYIHFSNKCVLKKTFLCVSRTLCSWIQRAAEQRIGGRQIWRATSPGVEEGHQGFVGYSLNCKSFCTFSMLKLLFILLIMHYVYWGWMLLATGILPRDTLRSNAFSHSVQWRLCTQISTDG